MPQVTRGNETHPNRNIHPRPHSEPPRSKLNLAACADLGGASIGEHAGDKKRERNPEEKMNVPMDHFPDHR
jgi:hypothetical protein